MIKYNVRKTSTLHTTRYDTVRTDSNINLQTTHDSHKIMLHVASHTDGGRTHMPVIVCLLLRLLLYDVVGKLPLHMITYFGIKRVIVVCIHVQYLSISI